MRTRPTATCTSRSAPYDGLRRALAPRRSTRWTRGREVEGLPAQAGSARFRAVEGGQTRRALDVGVSLWSGSARLAHRVLGDGARSTSARELRYPCRRQGPDSSPPRERVRAEARPRAASPWRGSGCTTACSGCDAEKMSKSVGNAFGLARGARAPRPGDAADVLLPGPLAPAAGVRRDPAGARRPRAAARIREAGRRLVRRRQPGTGRRRCASAFFDALARDFNAPRALVSVMSTGSADANRAERRHRRLRRTSRAMLDVLAPAPGCSTTMALEVPARGAGARRPRVIARSERDYAEADRLRDELRAIGWEVRDGPDGPELFPRDGG